jgi:hypothetical protein
MKASYDVSVAVSNESFIRSFEYPLELAVWMVDEDLVSLSELGSVHGMARRLRDCEFFIIHGLGGQQITVTRNDSALILF